MEKRWRKLSPERRQVLNSKYLNGRPHEYIRDWCVVDMEGTVDKEKDTLIIHMPSGDWHSFGVPYGEVLDLVQTSPDKDAELLEIIRDSSHSAARASFTQSFAA